MIIKIRKTIAYTLSIFVMLVSLGLSKPNFSGEPTLTNPSLDPKSTISLDVDKADLNHKR